MFPKNCWYCMGWDYELSQSRNAYYVRDLAAPFGGSCNSGVGREGGTWSFDFYCDVKNIAAFKGSFA